MKERKKERGVGGLRPSREKISPKAYKLGKVISKWKEGFIKRSIEHP